MHRVHWLASPHFNRRPVDAGIDLIVLHAISLPPGKFGTHDIEAFFTGRLDTSSHPSYAGLEDVRVSAHFVVDRSGVITQFVRCTDRAWHAGKSSWQGREHCNNYAIGIEMIGDEQQAFTREQYRECARLCRKLMLAFPAITNNRIVGHQDVAPGRKWDPGKQWHWPHFRRSLAHIKNTDLEIR